MRVLLSYLKNYWKLVILALSLATVNQIFSLIDPLILRHIIDDYATKSADYQGRNEAFIRGVATLLGLGIGAAMVSRIAKNFQDYFLNVISQKLGLKVYQDGLTHSLDLPYQDFEDQRSGQTLSILQKVRADSERFIISFVNIAFISLIGFVFVIIYAFTIHWLVATVYLTAVPIIAVLSAQLSKRIKKVQKQIVGETTQVAGATTESLRNIELIKSLGLSRQEEERLNNATNTILTLELKKVRYLRSLSFIQGTTINFIRTGIMFLMLYLILGNQLTTGQYMSLMIYSFFVFGPLQELGTVIAIYREAEVSFNNFDILMNAAPEPKAINPIPITEIKKLEFQNVNFKHKNAIRHALQDISFDVSRGETIAFAGPSGAGKTSLIKLLVGLYRTDDGNINYNDIDSKRIDFDEFREHIGFVTQDPQLFSGSIKDNLRFVVPDATDEMMMNALTNAACQNLLQRSEKGLDTVIGEGGMKVSGGEKQRLSIARALLRQPDMLIFDEATSSLDSLTEDEISTTIRRVTENRDRITILIAHRLSTIMHADRIYVLEKGSIIETGTHAELLAMKGLYYAMWRQQIGENLTITSTVGVAMLTV